MIQLALALAVLAAPAEKLAYETELTAFGRTGSLTVMAPAEQAEVAIEKAMAEIQQLDGLFDPTSPAQGGVLELNASAGKGPLRVDPRLLQLLMRAQSFCLWSDGAHGPLGGRLYDLLGLRQPALTEPTPDELGAAVASAACAGMRLNAAKGTAELAVGSKAELWSFGAGFALDRAVDILKQNGATTGLLHLGSAWRAFGGGPHGNGWDVRLPDTPGLDPNHSVLRLRDQALVIASKDDARLGTLLRPRAPYLDLTIGRAPDSVIAVLVLTSHAADAQGLAASLFALGNRRGQIRLGTLQPRPAALWVLGANEGDPLLVDYRFSEQLRKN